MRILVIEDDQETAAFITSGLKRSGYAVDHAADGEEGLELIYLITTMPRSSI